MTELNLIAAGGAGITVVDEVRAELQKHLKEIVKINEYALDSSTANKHRAVGKFYQFKGIDFKAASLAGGGGDQAKNAPAIKEGIQEFLSTEGRGILEYDPTKINIIVNSLSGATGSVTGIHLGNALQQKNIPYVHMVIGSREDLLYTQNTKTTLGLMYQVAMSNNKPVTVYYLNNSDENIKAVNGKIGGAILNLALLGSQLNESLDAEDMATFIDPTRYNKIKIPVGLNLMSVLTGDVVDKMKSSKNILVARILSNDYLDLENASLHTKNGIVIDHRVKAALGENIPVAIFTESGKLTEIVKGLDEAIENLTANLQTDQIDFHLQDEGIL